MFVLREMFLCDKLKVCSSLFLSKLQSDTVNGLQCDKHECVCMSDISLIGPVLLFLYFKVSLNHIRSSNAFFSSFVFSGFSLVSVRLNDIVLLQC